MRRTDESQIGRITRSHLNSTNIVGSYSLGKVNERTVCRIFLYQLRYQRSVNTIICFFSADRLPTNHFTVFFHLVGGIFSMMHLCIERISPII